MLDEGCDECGLPMGNELFKMLSERFGNMLQKKEEEYEMHSALSEEFLKEHKAIELEFCFTRNKMKELDARNNLLWARIMESVKIYDKDLRIEGEFLMIKKEIKDNK